MADSPGFENPGKASALLHYVGPEKVPPLSSVLSLLDSTSSYSSGQDLSGEPHVPITATPFLLEDGRVLSDVFIP